MIIKVGTHKISFKNNIIEEIFSSIQSIDYGWLYVGYPVNTDMFSNKLYEIDALLISPYGVIVFHIPESPLVDYSSVHDDLYVKIERRLKSNPQLLKKRELSFNLEVLSYSSSKETDNSNVFSTSNSVSEYIQSLERNVDKDLQKIINSTIQEIILLNTGKREKAKDGTKAALINNEQVRISIAEHDKNQMEAILVDPIGIQRIRGLAGSGKTIVLARKAVELHTSHPEWNIVLTYNTRAVRDMLTKLIDRHYKYKNEGQSPNYEKLKIMHAWGSSSSEGVYHNVCVRHGIVPLDFYTARNMYGLENAFSGACESLIKKVARFDKLFDCILIDEAQDLPVHFFTMCMKIIGPEKRLVYAYDELQKLNEEAMPTPEKLFGESIAYDTPLTASYRNQRSVIVTAHAIGMGIYRDIDNQNQKLVQIPKDISIWQVIGYKSDSEIKDGQRTVLYRDESTSPCLLEENSDDLIMMYESTDISNQFEQVLENLKYDLDVEGLRLSDIMIIDLDLLNNRFNYFNLNKFIDSESYDFSIHLAGTLTPEDFFRDDSIVYSQIHRAKGNEAYMVYIINCQVAMSNLKPISFRNQLFTAMTRSKGWVKMFGFGEGFHALEAEIKQVKEKNYKLVFEKYPNENERKHTRQTSVDLADDQISKFRDLVKVAKNVNKDQLDEIIRTLQSIKESHDE